VEHRAGSFSDGNWPWSIHNWIEIRPASGV